MSKSPASEPPTWRWIVTEVITKSRFLEPTRSHISLSASSMALPSRVSVSTRLNSSEAGGWPSSTTLWIACRKLCPAFSEAAIVIRRSGSWSSNAFRRRRALNQTKTTGSERPMPKPARIISVGAAETAATSAKTKLEPSAM
jgi:hypothetical protein